MPTDHEPQLEAWRGIYNERERGWAPHDAVIVRFSHKSNPKPYYLQRAMNLPNHKAVHLIFNEEFATLPEAEKRAQELSRV